MGSPTDIVSSIDTTNIAPGPQSKLEGVTPVFDLEREAQGYVPERDIEDEARWAEKAVAAGTEEQQAADSDQRSEADRLAAEERRPAGAAEPGTVQDGLPYAAQVTSPDSTGTDTTPASNVGHETVKGNITDTVDTSGTGGEPSDGPEGNVEAASDLTGPESATALASDPKSDAESANKVEGEPQGVERTAWEGFKVIDLQKIAKEKKVDLPSGASKAEIIDVLMGQGVKPPAAEDAQSAPSA